MVGFLSLDPIRSKEAKIYSTLTAQSCSTVGIEYELRNVDKEDLEEKIGEANEDNSIHGKYRKPKNHVILHDMYVVKKEISFYHDT